MNEICNQHNDLIDLPLRKFNASEIDILLALCYKVQNEDTNVVTLKLDDIKKLAHYKAKDNQQFMRDIKKTNQKLMNLNMCLENEKRYIQFVLFPRFEINYEKQELIVRVAEEFKYLLNNLTENYTSLELQQSSSLKSSYSKLIYKKLRRFKATGEWRVTVEDFKKFLDIPKSYAIHDIDKRVLNPAIDELKSIFGGLTVEKYYRKRTGQRGRPSVAGYIFKFTKEIPKKNDNTVLSIAKATDYHPTEFYCPSCKKSMYRKMLENENGKYTIYGHPDWKTGDCNYMTTEVTELLRTYDLEEDDVELTAEEKIEQEKDRKRLSDMMKKMFKHV